MDTWPELTAHAIREGIASRRLRAVDMVRAALAHIAVDEPAIHAWETLDADHALAQAHELDTRLAAGAVPGLLAGVPLGVKDILDTADLPTGYGSPIYRGARPVDDAHAVRLAREAGGIVLGKTVTTEFAYFTPGPTANPRNRVHTPGGSSSGSAAAVAAGMVPLAFGTQTAGSVIRPASFCGVFGLKGTFGSVSLAGVRPFAPSLDTLGWFARDADDLELMRCALMRAAFEPLPVLEAAALRIGVCGTHEVSMLDAGGADVWARAQALVSASGMRVRAVAMPASLTGLVDAQKTIMAFEATQSFAAEWRDHADQMSAALLALLETGRALGVEAYRGALELTGKAGPVVQDLMRGLDALLVPSAPGEAPAGLAATGDPVFNRVWTLLGLPCVNVPGLQGPNGLPIGLQLVGRQGQERALLAAAACLHRVVSSR